MTSMVLFVALAWLGLFAFSLLTSRESPERFVLANVLSVGVLGLLFHDRRPVEISKREKRGVVLVASLLVLVVSATLAGAL